MSEDLHSKGPCVTLYNLGAPTQCKWSQRTSFFVLLVLLLIFVDLVVIYSHCFRSTRNKLKCRGNITWNLLLLSPPFSIIQTKYHKESFYTLGFSNMRQLWQTVASFQKWRPRELSGLTAISLTNQSTDGLCRTKSRAGMAISSSSLLLGRTLKGLTNSLSPVVLICNSAWTRPLYIINRST